jgi:hypothetical protein
LARHKELARKTVEREGHDEEITALFDAIRVPTGVYVSVSNRLRANGRDDLSYF